MPELPNDQPPRQSHAEDHTEQIEAASREDNCRRTGRLQSKKEHYRADLQPKNPLWEISLARARPLPCLHRLQGLWQVAAFWVTMKKYNTGANLILVIKHVYNKTISPVLLNGSIGDLFWTTVRVRQACLLSPTLFNIFLEKIMTDALEDHEGTVSIRGRTITNLHSADDINGWAGEEEERAKLVEHIDKAFTAYSMEISAEKTKLMTNNTSNTTRRSK